MNKYDLVIFDVDGTLLDTSEGILTAVRYTIDKFGFQMLSDEKISSFIGPPIQDSFAREYGLKGDILQEIATVFRDYYKKEALFKASPYEGIYEVFQNLEDRKIQSAAATYKREDCAVSLLKHFGFDKYTGNIHGGDHENKLKKTDIIDLCISESGISDKNRIVMVGDSCHDAAGAELSGVDFIGVTFGFGFGRNEDLTKFKAVGYADKAIDILKFL